MDETNNTTEKTMTAAQCLMMFRGTRDRYWALAAARIALAAAQRPLRGETEGWY